MHDVIYKELCVGVIADDSRTQYRRIIADLADRGAEGILLGCTEIDLLVGPEDASVPVFDTTRLHADRAVDLALEPGRPDDALAAAMWSAPAWRRSSTPRGPRAAAR